MNSVERSEWSTIFPNLDLDRAVVSAPASSAYDCVAWSLNITDRILFPGAGWDQFVAYYRKNGMIPALSGPVAIWGLGRNQLTHASVMGPTHGPRWESKLGHEIRLQHDQDELISPTYGTILTDYGPPPPIRPFVQPTWRLPPAPGALSPTGLRLIRRRVEKLPNALRNEFASTYRDWQRLWAEPRIQVQSNPRARAAGPAYRRLLDFGPEVLPLVVAKLADHRQYLALLLYDALQTDPALKVVFPPDSWEFLEGEQGRARRSVHLWISNYKTRKIMAEENQEHRRSERAVNRSAALDTISAAIAKAAGTIWATPVDPGKPALDPAQARNDCNVDPYLRAIADQLRATSALVENYQPPAKKGG